MIERTRGAESMTLAVQSAIGPDVLGLLITNKCNFACRHCCNESGPANANTVRIEDVARIIDGARDVPSIREVGLSGGEPFLYLPIVREIVRHAAALGLSASVTTNGFWGRSPAAPKLLADLRSDGLTALHISTSEFHEEFRKRDVVVTAVRLALDAGLRVTVNIVATPGCPPAAVREALGELAEQVDFVVMPLLPSGRAARDATPAEFATGSPLPVGNCREHFRKLAVDLEGDVYPCCSPGGFTPPLKVGNVRALPLSEILTVSDGNRLLAVLESVGPAYFLPFLRAEGLDTELPESFSDQCHLCHAMLSSTQCAERVAAEADNLVNELAAMPASTRPSVSGRMAAVVYAAAATHDSGTAPTSEPTQGG